MVGEDYEWYPTTEEIIQVVAKDMKSRFNRRYDDTPKSMLDIGAGDGRVLLRVEELLRGDEPEHCRISIKKYAIEKAYPHLMAMPKEIVVVGTDFHQQQLVGKRFGTAFCNPPYKEFETWMIRIIRELSCSVIYLVVPKRWRKNKQIAEAIQFNGAKVKSLGEFDFEDADRKARAVVEVIRFRGGMSATKAFDAAVEEMLPELKTFESRLEKSKEGKTAHCQVTKSDGLIRNLVNAYDKKIDDMYQAYQAIVKTDPYVLSQLGVDKSSIINGIRLKSDNLKSEYWKRLFDNLTEVTKKLATKQRKEFLESLEGRGEGRVDFTESNILSVLIWISKSYKDHVDRQIIDLFKYMSRVSCVETYKSNQRVFEKSHWGYLQGDASHYKLNYRIVMETRGGIYTGQWSYEDCNGLCLSTRDVLMDFITVANNLGFDCDDKVENYHWKSNKQNIFLRNDGEQLAAVRAFKNGNVHIKMANDFCLALNVQAGKLLGWLRTSREAAEELQEKDVESVEKYFAKSTALEAKDLLKIANTKTEHEQEN